MGIIKNALRVVGTIGLGAVAGVSKFMSESCRKEGYITDGIDELTETCMNGIKKIWGEEVEETPPKTIYDRIGNENNIIYNYQLKLDKLRDYKNKAIEAGRYDIVEKCNEDIVNCKKNILEHRNRLFNLKEEAGEDISESEIKSYYEYEDLSEE